MFMRTFDRAEYTVNGGREKSVGDTSREIAESCSLEELDAMIDEARARAKAADLKAQQELLIGRIARSMKNARTAQAVHDNFRRFGAFLLLLRAFLVFGGALCHQPSLTRARTHTIPPHADINKDHLISRQEFRSSFHTLLALGEKEIEMLADKFFVDGIEELNYDNFMSVIHAYADKPLRS